MIGIRVRAVFSLSGGNPVKFTACSTACYRLEPYRILRPGLEISNEKVWIMERLDVIMKRFLTVVLRKSWLSSFSHYVQTFDHLDVSKFFR